MELATGDCKATGDLGSCHDCFGDVDFVGVRETPEQGLMPSLGEWVVVRAVVRLGYEHPGYHYVVNRHACEWEEYKLPPDIGRKRKRIYRYELPEPMLMCVIREGWRWLGYYAGNYPAQGKWGMGADSRPSDPWGWLDKTERVKIYRVVDKFSWAEYYEAVREDIVTSLDPEFETTLEKVPCTQERSKGRA